MPRLRTRILTRNKEEVSVYIRGAQSNVKHFLALTSCLLVLFSGTLSAIGNCFDRAPHRGAEDHGFASIALSVGAASREHSNDASRIHCPDLKFSIALARVFSNSNLKTQLDEDPLYRQLVYAARGAAMSESNCEIAAIGNGPSLLLRKSISPHLFLSVLQI